MQKWLKVIFGFSTRNNNMIFLSQKKSKMKNVSETQATTSWRKFAHFSSLQ